MKNDQSKSQTNPNELTEAELDQICGGASIYGQVISRSSLQISALQSTSLIRKLAPLTCGSYNVS